jgi:hypothetical protein
MFFASSRTRIARTVVGLIAAGFVQIGVSSPSAYAAPPVEPTFSSVTADASSITINMVTTGINATSWRYIITRRSTSGCAAASAGDGVVQSTASLLSSFSVTGLTSGCYYSIKVAGYNGVIGDYNETDKLVGSYSSVLNVVYQNDAGTGSTIVRTPFTSGCNVTTVSNINYSFATGPSGCNATFYTGYLSGYIKAPYTGTVTFKMSTDDAGVLAIQGNAIAVVTSNGSATGTFSMVAGQVYRFEEWFHNDSGGAGNYVYWSYTGQAEQIIPAGNFANDPSVLAADGGCTLGMAARCAAGSAQEIKQATGTNTDGQYWIVMNGTPTLVYCVMNSLQGGGGWMLAMRGKNSSSTFSYNSAYWTNTTLLNDAYPDRFSASDVARNSDAKYAPFAYATGNQVMVLYPEVTTLAGGAFGTNGSANASGINGVAYGFAWHETFTAGTAWTSYNSTTRFGGGSSGYNPANYQAGGNTSPAATSTCVTSPNTLTYLFTNASRCAFRQVQSNYNASEAPYSAVGNNVFFSQTDIRFFGINYGNASATFITKSRIGFGWNENGGGVEDSNDGNGGIGLYSTEAVTVAAGTINGCCTTTNNLNPGQTGLSSGDHTARHLGYELYVRNATTASVAGRNLRVTSHRPTSLTAGSGFFASGTNGTNTFHISPLREGFSIDSSTGVITVSENISIGTYTETVTVVDSAGVSAAKSMTIQVVADSSETDTALSFDGTQALSTTGTVGLWSDQTWEIWAKPTTTCSNASNATILGTTNFVIFCNSSDWWLSFKDSAGNWNGYKTSQRVVQNEWMHFAVVRSGSNISMYANNRQLKILVSSAWVDSYSQTIRSEYPSIYLGGTGGAGQYFTGVLDEVKVWSEARTLTQIWSGAHTAENISSNGLLMYWDFNEGSGSAISRGQRADDNFNFTPLNANQWVPVATTTKVGPYTVVAVPRTLINKIGGWRAPDSITAITTLVLGGGGGGGGGYQGGGGGAGGFIESTVTVDPKSVYSIRVGVGGGGTTNPIFPTNGDTSTAFGLSAAGGGSGMAELTINAVNQQQPAGSGGSGGGASHGTVRTAGSGIAGQGNAGAYGVDIYPTCSHLAGGGGGGAGGVGSQALCVDGANGPHGGYGGAAKYSAVLDAFVAGGGGGSVRTSTGSTFRGFGSNGTVSNGGNSGFTSGALVGATGGATVGSPNTGTGGGAGLSTDGATGYGGDGGSGTVTFRYITALKPSYTQPSNAFLNTGMTETFSVNVATDSATAVLTRTFRWESTTAGSGGTYSLLKQGTGASNAAFSWIPQDTATSGSQYLYRLIVTDSDTAGLFIQDTSTAVYATINKALVLSAKASLTKTVGVSKTETFTVTLGTPTYSYKLEPSSPYFWLDTSTAGSPRIKFADTVTVGTYYETFTVTDSVTASLVQPLTIVVSAPPSFSANAEQLDSGTVLYLDAGNIKSHPGTGVAWNDISGRGLVAYETATVTNLATVSQRTCTAPAYSTEAIGSLVFTKASSNCAYVASFGLLNTFTTESWIKPSGNQDYLASILANPWNSDTKINIVVEFTGTNTIAAGIYVGSSNWYVTPNATVTLETWTMVSTTYDGATLKLYLNGVFQSQVSVATTFASDSSFRDGLFIGRRWDSDQYFNGSIGSVRIYSRSLSLSEIQQNFNATKGRFLQTQNKIAPVGKYGTTVNESYTVTAGSESITATFTASAVAGLVWDTSTARTLRVQYQDSLTAGTYYDTITVTDIYGSSTRLPLKLTIAKADTITVYIDTPTALNYTGSPAVFNTPLRVSGLVSSDTGTAVTINYKPGNQTCATGGPCAIGDIGPGGGIVFITPSTPSGNGKYFEAAPANWTGSDDIASVGKFCTAATSQDGISRGASQFGIGWGDTNTSLFDSNCTGGAVRLAADYAGGGFTDWFIPNTNEATQLMNYGDTVGLLKLGANWTTGTWGYWASTENSSTQMKAIQNSGGTWVIGATEKSDSTHNMVRPVRMFSPCWAVDTCTSQSSATKPTQAGTYVIVPSSLTLTSGSLSNYVAVRYDTTTVTINRVNQASLVIPYFNPIYPETLTINIGGGNGNGFLKYTLTGNGNATGCALDYKKLSVTSVGSCEITVVKRADRNYLTETTTAYIVFVQYIINQPAPVVGSGSAIALSGRTSVSVDPFAAPYISDVVWVPLTCYGNMCELAHWEIRGSGFGASDNSDTVVKFWRNRVVTLNQNSYGGTRVVNDTLIIISPDDVPAGVTTGKITVTTANGIAVSPNNWIAP